MTIQLSWIANPAEELVSEYKVYESTNGVDFLLRSAVPSSETSLDIVNPPAGSYSWKVSAVNVAGEGPQSDVVVGPSLPSAPTGLGVEVV